MKSHFCKILEKAILGKLKELDSGLLSSGIYQRGFKEGVSPSVNIQQALEKIYMRKKRNGLHLFLDLSKA